MKRFVDILLLLAIPIIAALVAYFRKSVGVFDLMLPYTIIVCAGYCAILVIYSLDTKAKADTVDDIKAAKDALIREILELKTKVDFLSAEREITLTLNENVDFKTILEKVLSLTSDVFESAKNEIAIYLKNGADDELVLRALRKDSKMFFDIEQNADPLIHASFKHGKLITTADEDTLNIITPLSADRELLGILKISAALEGNAEERSRKIQMLSQNVEELAKFIALAVKTPDLYTRAVEDGLTGLGTKRHFTVQLNMHAEFARRYSTPLSLIMMDIDYFKNINDTYGHLAGDEVLKGVGEIVRRSVRRSDDAARGYRYGGEEIAIILPKTDTAKALEVVERIRYSIEEKNFGDGIKVTVSSGVAEFGGDINSAELLVAKADEALYIAKQSGRNKTISANNLPQEHDIQT